MGAALQLAVSVNSCPRSGVGLDLKLVDRAGKAVHVGGQVLKELNRGAKMLHESLVAGLHHVANEFLRQLFLKRQAFILADRGVHHQAQGEWNLARSRKIFDQLSASVFRKRKVFAFQVGDQPLVLVRYSGPVVGDVDKHAAVDGRGRAG